MDVSHPPVPDALAASPGVVVVAGYYGVGKTTLSLNLAMSYSAAGRAVTLIDLDVVNPYFRSSDHREALREQGIEVLAPLFAGTALDTPSVSGAVSTAVAQARDAGTNGLVIIDAGGDDAGATALGRFADDVAAGDYTFIYVVNRNRVGARGDEEVAATLQAIEAACHLQATGIVGNNHLMEASDAARFVEDERWSAEIASALDLPLMFVTVPPTLSPDYDGVNDPANPAIERYYVQTPVAPPW